MKHVPAIAITLAYLALIPVSIGGILSAMMSTGSPGVHPVFALPIIFIWGIGPVILLFSSILMIIRIIKNSYNTAAITYKVYNPLNPFFPIFYLFITVVVTFVITPILDSII
jgi:hypothetical protein